ncbi:MAG: exopolysaccharide biosynthesis polyprenyl glycosylphosphotransferase [Candidatus Absconditabacteria bacterium]|nr:exopolysaccharide biosynthesis polyprenyl glycosylphosphotransferase [Candidatus Absconditabacteria bacterium]
MKQLNIGFRLLRPVVHGFIIIIIFSLTYKLRLVTDLIPGVQLNIPLMNYRETMIYAWIATIIFIGLGIIKSLYELHKPIQKYFQTFTKVWLYWLVTITFIAYFGQGFIFYFGISRFIILVGSGIVFFVLFFFDQIRNYIESKFNQKSDRKIIIIGSDILGSYKAIENIKSGFSYKTEFIRAKNLKDVELDKYFIAIAVGSFEKELLQEIFEKTRFSYTRFYHISEGFFLEDVVYSPEAINNIVALEYKNSTLDGWSLIWKRLFDVFASFILIIIFLPVMIVIGIAIKINSPGSIFFFQKRVGKGSKLFTFVKFRSMFTHLSTGGKYGGKEAEKLYQQLIASDANIRGNILPKIKNDPRITKVGKFLRKTSLDELPQLFCVLIGTMSLVGPRPHLPGEVEKYEIWQKRLLSIKPGITGYAQVFGRDNLDFEDEAKLDLYYIQNRSIFMDLYILFATFGVVFKGK